MFIEIYDEIINLNAFKIICPVDSFNHYKGYTEYSIHFQSIDNDISNDKIYNFNSKEARNAVFNYILEIATKKQGGQDA